MCDRTETKALAGLLERDGAKTLDALSHLTQPQLDALKHHAQNLAFLCDYVKPAPLSQ